MALRTSVLRHRDFRLLFVGQTVSAIGDQVFPVAVALKVLDTGGSATDLGLVLTGRALAMVLFVLAGGILADRFRRTRMMAYADAVRLVAVLGLALVPGQVPVPMLAALTFLVGAGEALFRPAYGAIVPSVLPEAELPAGNALASVSVKSAFVVGPALAAAAIGVGGVRLAFLFDAATFAVSMVTVLAIAEPRLVARVRRSALAEALEGVRAVRERPWIGAILLMATIHLMLVVAPYMVLLPIVARERLGGDGAFATVLIGYAVSGVPAALLAGRWQPRRPGLWSLLALLPWAGLLLSLAYADSLWTVTAWAVAAGAGVEPFLVWWSSALQRAIPRELLARVIALDWLASFALMPIGLALTGPAVRAFGRAPVLWVAAVTLVVSTLLPLAVPGVAELTVPSGDSRRGARRSVLRPRHANPKP